MGLYFIWVYSIWVLFILYVYKSHLLFILYGFYRLFYGPVTFDSFYRCRNGKPVELSVVSMFQDLHLGTFFCSFLLVHSCCLFFPEFLKRKKNDQIEFHCWTSVMRPSVALQANRDAIRSVVERHRARNARVFGSVLYGDDHEGSDLDILIDPTPETTMFDIGAIRHELLQMLGVQVDVLTPNALPDSFRAKVIAEARPV
jgi:predicted nucleotidyltransferase